MSRSLSFVSLPVLAILAAVAVGSPARAQTKPGEIKGIDAMGDKSRSAQDGWSQAPVPREQSAAKDAPDPGGHSIQENANRPVPPANPGGSSATEPQAPLEHRTASPSGTNPANPSK
ncbi:hypothetical protein GOFOIKOB_3912 [Methylobacterium tardum]|uniref:Secreted protein n=1 Tax=Methylobacterium tardum TaxID=374432 RepID=A0AA37TBC8_9HYPH|nr:hypothetical protein [Methylobacterium tardum]URD38019.1 hypothetical protein M6G65_05900 [Methylobacterium tardum]GJE50858.1 hypothetical protein GOFOIKOB_3912 [Methylobacterium tardum]GLS70311.1 hypothetical protein GCM10007890_23240 [Methylobacterium tardum]